MRDDEVPPYLLLLLCRTCRLIFFLGGKTEGPKPVDFKTNGMSGGEGTLIPVPGMFFLFFLFCIFLRVRPDQVHNAQYCTATGSGRNLYSLSVFRTIISVRTRY